MADTQELITTGEAAGLLGVSAQTVRRWEKSGDLIAVRTPGNQRRFHRATVEALLRIPVEVPVCRCVDPVTDDLGQCDRCKRKPAELLRRPA